MMNKFVLLATVLILGASNISDANAIIPPEPNKETSAVILGEDLYAMCIILHPLNSSRVKSMEIVLPQESELLVEKAEGPVVKIRDLKGRVTVLNNDIEVLNFMSKNGWEFKQAFSYTANSMNVIKYIFVKKST